MVDPVVPEGAGKFLVGVGMVFGEEIPVVVDKGALKPFPETIAEVVPETFVLQVVEASLQQALVGLLIELVDVFIAGDKEHQEIEDRLLGLRHSFGVEAPRGIASRGGQYQQEKHKGLG